MNYGVAPWYYEQLSILNKKIGKIDESILILERFSKQTHAAGSSTIKLLEKYKNFVNNNIQL